MTAGKIFPEIEGTKNYAERYYAIKEYLKNNDNFLYNYVYTWSESDTTLRNHYGVPYPIKPLEYPLHYFPFAISKQGEIICLPNFNICPSIMVYGTKRVGKTILCHRFIEYFHWWLRYKIFIGNDYSNEVFAWANPCKSNEFYKKIRIFGERPSPLPIFLVIPNSNSDLGMSRLKTPKITITLPTKYLVKHIEDFVDLDKSESYLKKMDFTGCESEDDIKKRIEESFEEQEVPNKARIAMKPKIKNMLDLFFEDGMLSFDKKVIENLKLDNDNSVEDPIVQLLKCGVIPTLITTQLQSKTWFPNYFKAKFNQIITYKQNDKNFKKTNFLIYIDELNKILVDKKIIDTIGSSIAQGGMLNIAFLGAAHHPTEIHKIISGGCKYIFCFNMNDEKDINKVKKDYNLDKYQSKIIHEAETFEFIGKSKEEKFIVYNPKSNVWYRTDYVHGFVIPPASHHLPPASSKRDFFSGMENEDSKITTNYAKKVIIENNIKLRNPKENNHILRVCRCENKDIFHKFDIIRPKLIEGIDYRRAFWGIKMDKNTTTIEVDYNFLINNGIKLYQKDKKYFLCYIKEERDDFIPFKKLPDNVIIQYNPFFQQFRILSERNSSGWYPTKKELGFE